MGSQFAPAPPTIAAPGLSLPVSGGALRGIAEKLSANPATGTASLSVPIATSPGRSGFGPHLALSYDSGRGNGVFGLGWSLSLAAITRRTDRGLPKYDDTDVFLLSDVEDLVAAMTSSGDGGWAPTSEENPAHAPGYRIDRFRPRIEGLFARIERWTRLADGDTHWRSVTRDNVTSWYGLDAGSRIADPDNSARVFSWLLCRSEDRRGNAIVYEYLAESGQGVDVTRAHETHRDNRGRSANRYPKRILYGNRVSTLVDPAPADPGWMFEVVFDYGEEGTGALPCRTDPFSSYRAGFEVRTYRLCQRVLMFHHFPAEAGVGTGCLVRSTDFAYTPGDSIGTFLGSVTQRGYRRDGSGYVTRSLPSAEFGYTQAVMRPEVREVDPDSVANLPAGAGGTAHQWTDLDGEGIPGVLVTEADSWFYKPNLGDGRFGPVRQVAGMPARSIGSARSPRLMDLAGDGRLDVVSLAGPTPGFVTRTADGDWLPWEPFDYLPTVDFDDPDTRLVDLTGDGLADLLVAEGESLTWYASLGAAGFAAGIHLSTAAGENSGPRLVFSDGTGALYLADMTGDGLSDLVRIRNGSVCYWPNLGHGRFGARVSMDDAPWFDTEELFDQEKVRLADVDGSGPTDLLYLGSDSIRVYLNLSGNGWAPQLVLPGIPPAEADEQVDAIDLLGTGTTCLVWSSTHAGNASRPMRYADLLGGVKPHLLERMVNNLGAEILVRYAPSTRFYLSDRAAGQPWLTRLPFPVQVVERVETYDRVSGNRFVSRFAYHDGYFDGIDREFRGFGLTEQWDTEELTALHDVDLTTVSNVDPVSHVPPMLTKTWLHTGAFAEMATLPETLLLPDGSRIPHRPTTEELREAFRALKGSVLRREVYALDGSAAQDLPYEVSEHRFAVELLQPMAGQPHSVCLARPQETITHHFERKLYDVETTDGPVALADPRVSHQLTLEVDGFGNVLRGAEVAYGRRYPDVAIDAHLAEADLAALRAAQTTTHTVLTENTFTNAVDEPETYRTPLPAQSRSFELINVSPSAALFTLHELSTACDTASDGEHDLPYEDADGQAATGAVPYRRLIEHHRSLYRRDDLAGALPLGEVQPLGMPYANYRLAFTPGLLVSAYRADRAGVPTDLLPDAPTVLRDEGGYLLGDDHRAAGLFPPEDPDGLWWAPSGSVHCSPGQADQPATELAYARAHFFLPGRYVDAFGNVTTVSYDEYDLLVAELRDPLGNATTAGDELVPRGNDYRVLAPRIVSDPNRNRTAVVFDALGMVTATAVMGKPGEQLGDSLDGVDPDPDEATILAYFADPLADPHLLLASATTRLLYDLSAYSRGGQPAATATLTRETHVSDLAAGAQSPVRQGFAYSDGFGREVQRKLRAEPGPLGPRWVGSGWAIVNNKGLPVRRYEPFFSDTHGYEFAHTSGVSPVLCYDPVGRLMATLHPDHTWGKVAFDPWRQETWDAADTALIADPRHDADLAGHAGRLAETDFLPTWYAQRTEGALGVHEQAAASKAATYAGTPSVAHLDALGRTVLTVTHNRYPTGEEEFHTGRVLLDIEGNERAVLDAAGRVVMRSEFNLLGNPLRSLSMEAGERWMLSDVAGRSLYRWDSRGHRSRATYDALGRPLDVFIRAGDGPEWTAERHVYGESLADAQERNLRGRTYQAYDAAGVVTMERYDIKGNAVSTSRELAVEYRSAPDWSTAVALNTEIFTTSTSVDALNRPVALTTPDGSVIRPRYNEAGLPEAIEVNLRPFVTNIDYDVKGRRERIEYGNGTSTLFTYDPITLRLSRMLTMRGSESLQDLSYTYDPVGNITHVEDAAQQTVFFRNTRVVPDNDYVYDAVYRLIEATGREHLGQTGVPSPPDPHDTLHSGLTQPGDGQAMGRYLQSYHYDPAGNITQVRHTGSDPAHPGWTRDYTYAEASLTEPGKTSNRLSYTQVGGGSREGYAYDGHGNMTAMAPLPLLRWNHHDQLEATAQQVVNAGTPETTWYVYDSKGQRVRKVTDRAATDGELPTRRSERLYLGGGFEIYREYAIDGAATVLERQTLHVMDGQHRIAMVETRTVGDDGSAEELVRYQYGDHLGSAGLELDDAGRIISYEEYYPHGSTSYQAVDPALRAARKRYRYTGMERDEETGLALHGARYYAPWLGRWTSADPAGLADGPNLYAYASGNPLNGTDRGGMGTEATEAAANSAKVLKHLLWGNPHLDADRNGMVDNTNVSLPQLAQAMVGHYEGGISARDTAASILGVSPAQWNAAKSAYLNQEVATASGNMTQGQWLSRLTGADLASVRENIAGAVAWLATYVITDDVEKANAVSKPAAALGSAALSAGGFVRGSQSSRFTANTAVPESSAVTVQPAPAGPPQPPKPPAPPAAPAAPPPPPGPPRMSPIGMSAQSLGRLSDSAAEYVARNYPQFGGVVATQVKWTMLIDGRAVDGRADAMASRGPDGRPALLAGKFGIEPSFTKAEQAGYGPASAGQLMVIGQQSGHRGFNPAMLGTPFNGSRGVDVWIVSNAPGNVLGPPVVWQSHGNVLRVAIPPMNIPPPNFKP